MAFQTEVEFTLPQGYMDSDGTLHQEGVMRLATAADEILPLKDPRVQANPAYLTVIVLSRVVTRLGGLPDVNPRIVENLYASDVSYLQSLYQRINADGNGTPQGGLPAVRAPASRWGSTAWGKHDGLSPRAAVRGDGLHRLPLPLVAGRADEHRTPRAPPLVRGDLAHQPQAER